MRTSEGKTASSPAAVAQAPGLYFLWLFPGPQPFPLYVVYLGLSVEVYEFTRKGAIFTQNKNQTTTF